MSEEVTKEVTEERAPKAKRTRKPSGPKKVKINIAKTESDKYPVQVGLNGYQVAIPRGVDVEVPEGIVEVLEHAVETHFDADMGEPRDVLRYPFQRVS